MPVVEVVTHPTPAPSACSEYDALAEALALPDKASAFTLLSPACGRTMLPLPLGFVINGLLGPLRGDAL